MNKRDIELIVCHLALALERFRAVLIHMQLAEKMPMLPSHERRIMADEWDKSTDEAFDFLNRALQLMKDMAPSCDT